MATILDYSAGYPGGAAVRSAGHSGVIRYLRKEGNSIVRPITPAEYSDMRANGRAVALVYQHVSKSRVTEGRAAGRHDAQWALARARELNAGDPRAIYFAVDFDAPTSDFPAIGAYMAGAAEILGTSKVGTYGKWSLLDYLFDRNLITWGWQTYAWSPGHNQDPATFHPRAHLFQRLGLVTVNGISCDVNSVLKADYGQFGVNDMELTDRIGNVRMSDGEDYNLTVGDVLWGLAQLIQGNGSAGGNLTAHPTGQYNSRILGLSALPEIKSDVDTVQNGVGSLMTNLTTANQRLIDLMTAVENLSTGGVDVTALATQIVDLLGPDLATTLANELDRRARDNDPSTGPTS